MGGILMHAKKGRIVCSNTLDDRLQLCYGEAIPDIRRTLFPSFKKKEPTATTTAPPKHHWSSASFTSSIRVIY